MDDEDKKRAWDLATDYWVDEINNYIIDKENEIYDDQLSDGGLLREQMIQWIQMGIDTEVYGAYPHPAMYERRRFYEGSGGIGDPDNIKIERDRDTGYISWENVAKGNSDYFPTDAYIEDIILSGYGYHYEEGKRRAGTFLTPRNFYSVLEEEMENGCYVIDEIHDMVSEAIIENGCSIFIDCLRRACSSLGV